MTLPNFIIIGAMKAGSTTLFRDLCTNPDIFMPDRKEPNAFCDDRVLTSRGRREYEALFRPARPGQVAGEASTSYTKLPDIPGVAERVRRVLGGGVRLVYLVREPVARAISHHRHAINFRDVPRSIDEAVRSHPMLIQYGLYAMQARPWLDTFGAEAVRIVPFEEYVRDRRAGVERISRFLGVTPRPELVEVERVFNAADEKPVSRGPFGLVRRQGIYQKFIRPLLSNEAREALRVRLLPKAPPPPAPPSLETVDIIIERVRDDAEELRRMLGLPAPLWDFDAVRRKHAARLSTSSTDGAEGPRREAGADDADHRAVPLASS